MTKTRYVVGFAFDERGDHVLLIEKRRPEWQSGRLNGIGGHVEEGENGHEAMVREFEEETGLETTESEWQCFAKLVTTRSVVDVFTARLSRERALGADDKTDEKIQCVRTADLADYETVPNLRWLVPLALRADDLLNVVEVVEAARYETA